MLRQELECAECKNERSRRSIVLWDIRNEDALRDIHAEPFASAPYEKHG